ncbi:hypothetical protein BJ912DRAFT_927554 [Pholiota molesta]|nr:hypothetical protein BJ912DRAFT_927554 [Pholiota molesta]
MAGSVAASGSIILDIVAGCYNLANHGQLRSLEGVNAVEIGGWWVARSCSAGMDEYAKTRIHAAPVLAHSRLGTWLVLEHVSGSTLTQVQEARFHEGNHHDTGCTSGGRAWVGLAACEDPAAGPRSVVREHSRHTLTHDWRALGLRSSVSGPMTACTSKEREEPPPPPPPPPSSWFGDMSRTTRLGTWWGRTSAQGRTWNRTTPADSLYAQRMQPASNAPSGAKPIRRHPSRQSGNPQPEGPARRCRRWAPPAGSPGLDDEVEALFGRVCLWAEDVGCWGSADAHACYVQRTLQATMSSFAGIMSRMVQLRVDGGPLAAVTIQVVVGTMRALVTEDGGRSGGGAK